MIKYVPHIICHVITGIYIYTKCNYAYQDYVIKFASDLRQVAHDTPEILLKVALNTINLNQPTLHSETYS
jgi:hypothetical protein